MRNGWNKIVVVFAIFFAVFSCKNLLAGQGGAEKCGLPKSSTVGWVEEQNPTNHPEQGDASKPTKEEVIQKTQTLQMPFIVNNGQVDERVSFYAKTFGGTVFVTKDGEIVYSLPSGRDVPAGASQESGRGLKHGCREAGRDALHASLYHVGQEDRAAGAGARGGKVVLGWHGQALLVRVESEFVVANAYSPLLHADIANCPPDRIIAKSLLASYLPGLLVETTRWVVCPLSMPPNYNPHSEIQNPQSPMRGVALKEHLVGGKVNEIKGGAQSVTTVSYFKGNDPSKWKSNLSTYEVVDMGEVYKGISLRLKAYGNNVEKLFTVTPDANPEAIKLGLSGAKVLRINEEGQLEADTELGPVKFTKPVAYQEIEGKRVEVAVEYCVQGSGDEGMESRVAGEQGGRGEPETQDSKFETRNSKLTYGFTVASYDKTKDLIIDPLLASTFLGGTGADRGYSITRNTTSGDVYVTGDTQSTNFPTTGGAYDIIYNGGGDVFVSRLNSGLTTLLASTFLGGSGWDYGQSITLGAGGSVYVTGVTASSDFPTTVGAYDTTFNGVYDVFVSRLNSGLTQQKSTYLGGTGWDYGQSITLGAGGFVYVTGVTASSDFPATVGAYDTIFNGVYDVFVSRLNSGLTQQKSTYLGGSGADWGYSITRSGAFVYVTGTTASPNFPTTNGTVNSGGDDVFVSRLNSGLTSMPASTLLGGSGADVGYSLIRNGAFVYVTGATASSNFPVTSGVYGGGGDAFVSRLNSGLTTLLASTFLGGSSADVGYSLTRDAAGSVYVTGVTASSNFPTTPGVYDISYNGNNDVFVSRLNSGLTTLLASTFLGGSSADWGTSLTLGTGGVYVTGMTASSGFPVTSGVYGGGGDAFVSKLNSGL